MNAGASSHLFDPCVARTLTPILVLPMLPQLVHHVLHSQKVILPQHVLLPDLLLPYTLVLALPIYQVLEHVPLVLH